MIAFDSSARYYDLLYREKDYQAEASFVLALLRKNQARTDRILDLGCGTGNHALRLAESGATVHGVDRSALMLERSETKRQAVSDEVGARVVFSQGDVTEVRLGSSFDAVITLFHVLSYQVRNDEVAKTFATAKAHLKPNGLFIFDCWYGPGVLTDRPAVRVKRLHDDRTSITRIAEPVLHANENVVDVNYTIFVFDGFQNVLEELKELHRMRYFFAPELRGFAAQAGLEILSSYAWMKDTEPDVSTWNACFVLRA